MASIFNFSSIFIYACFLILTIIHAFVSPLSFNFSSIGPQDEDRFMTEGTAFISEEGIEVKTDLERSARATYVDPLHLWDNSSGNLTDFHTHFSFLIQSNGTVYADGLAFFMSPVDSRIPENSWGSALGLAFRNNASVKPVYPFVAFEFDTYHNDWDPIPPGPHVGIDINSLISAANATWSNNITQGRVNDAWISYNSSSKIIRVDFTGFSNNQIYNSSVEYTVDLRLHLPEWVRIGFSAATGLYAEKHQVMSWDFSSNLELNNTTDSNPTAGKKAKKVNRKVIGLSIGLSVLVPGLIFLGYCLWIRKKNVKEEEDDSPFDASMENEFERVCGPNKFSYEELVRATDNFSEERKLGEGGFGGVYLGFLKDVEPNAAAVKRVSKSSKQGAKEYASEVKIISQLRHRNLVRLMGWCHDKRELLLVYEYLPNGSLDSHLFRKKSLLSWETRYSVVQGLASALLYLHEEWEQCVIHRDIKSSNVMLDSSFNAKLGDFGLARLVDHEKTSQTTVLAGTLGYMAPEYVITGKASKESDVYSFGIVALEIACGRKAIDISKQENEVRMVEWVWEMYSRGVHLDAADPKLSNEYNAEEMRRLLVVGLWCAHPDNAVRPSIRQAIKVLSFEAEPPVLSSKMPLPKYMVSFSSIREEDKHPNFTLSSSPSVSLLSTT